MASNYVDLPVEGGSSGVISLNGLVGALSLIAGANITVTPSGSNITISAGGASGLTSINSDATAAQLLTIGTAGVDFAIVDAGSGSHVFNLPTASASNRGALSSADWSTFNSKQAALTLGNLTDAGTDGITVTGGTGAVVGSGTSLSQHVADATHNGYLSQVDWSTFNSKQAALTIGNLTDAGTDGIVVTGGTGSVIGSGTSIAQHVADTTHNGYLSSTDWNTFNGKQATVTIGALDAQAANANGLAFVSNVLSTQSADVTHPGVVNTAAQTLAGQKSFSSSTLFADGAVGTPGISFINDTGSGLYRIGANNIGLAINGQKGMDVKYIAANTVNFAWGSTPNASNTVPIVFDRPVNGSVFYQYGNSSTGTSSQTIFQIVNGTGSNYTTVENCNGLTTGYMAGGTGFFGGTNQLFTVLGSEISTGTIRFTVGGRTLATERMRLSTSNLLVNVHMTSNSASAPTAAPNANAGTSATSTVAHATDVAGVLNLTLGSGSWASGAQTAVTFATAYGVAPLVVLTPTNATTATNMQVLGVYVTSTTTTFTVNFANAGTGASVLQWNYHIIETA